MSSYKSADAVISRFGELDLDDLKTQKETREKQLAEVKTQIRENEKLRSIIGALGTIWEIISQKIMPYMSWNTNYRWGLTN